LPNSQALFERFNACFLLTYFFGSFIVSVKCAKSSH